MRPSPGCLRPSGRPPADRPGRGREPGQRQLLLRPARPLLARAPPSPTPRSAGARDLRAGSPPRARRPLPSARPPRGGLSGGRACPSPPLPRSLPVRRPRAAGLLWRLAPWRCHLAEGTAAGPAGPRARTGGKGRAGPRLGPSPQLSPRLPSPTRGGGAPPSPRARAPGGGRAGARRSGVCEA